MTPSHRVVVGRCFHVEKVEVTSDPQLSCGEILQAYFLLVCQCVCACKRETDSVYVCVLVTIHMKTICTVHSIIKTIVIVIHITAVIVLHAFYVHCCLLKYTHTHTLLGEKNKSSHIIVADE